MSRLAKLPIDRVKLAMQFIQGIDGGGREEAVANVIIDLARTLGLKVIAEGAGTWAESEEMVATCRTFTGRSKTSSTMADRA